MKIKRIAYASPDETKLLKWVDHIIEKVIFEEINILEQQRIELQAQKFFQEIKESKD